MVEAYQQDVAPLKQQRRAPAGHDAVQQRLRQAMVEEDGQHAASLEEPRRAEAECEAVQRQLRQDG